MKMLLYFFILLVLSRASYLVNSMEVTMEILLFLFLVPGKSQVITLRGAIVKIAKGNILDGL
jgi:hypothetical protein